MKYQDTECKKRKKINVLKKKTVSSWRVPEKGRLVKSQKGSGMKIGDEKGLKAEEEERNGEKKEQEED